MELASSGKIDPDLDLREEGPMKKGQRWGANSVSDLWELGEKKK